MPTAVARDVRWIIAIAFTAAVAAAAAIPVAAEEAEEGAPPVILDAGEVESGDVFPCRIPVDVRYDGTPKLTQLRVIAKVYGDGEELASTGLAEGEGPIVRDPEQGVLLYRTVPLQFDLSPELCDRIDGLRIDFASCVFGEHPAENCIDRIRFADADSDDPRFLPVGE